MDQSIEQQIQFYRDQIDQTDQKILDLLVQRQRAVKKIGAIKKKNNIQIYDPKRELQTRTKRRKLAQEKNLDSLQTEMVFEQIVLMARDAQFRERSKTIAGYIEPSQKTIRVGVMGGIGSFSEAAALQFLKKHEMEKYELYYPISTKNVLRFLDEGKIDIGIFPIENSLAGMVMESIQAISKHVFDIVEIFEVDVIQCLLTLPGIKKENIRKIMSHPHALSQCQNYLRKNFPDAQLVEGTDTAEGARYLEENPDQTSLAVIAPKRCAELYHLEVLEEGIQDQKKNFTRFIAARKNGETIVI